MQNITPLLFAANAVALIIVGAYVYFADRKKSQNAIWLVYNILLCIWSFCIYKAMESESAVVAKYWLMTSLSAMIFMVPVFLHFLSVYSDKEAFRRQILGKIYILFFLFFLASFVLPREFITAVEKSGYFNYIIVPGIAFNVFVSIFAGFVFCGFYYLLHSAKLYLGFRRNQRLYIFLGMLLGTFAPLGYFLAVYKIHSFPFGVFCILPYLALVSYTLLRYHVFEMDIVVNQTVVLSYFALFVLLVHIFIVHVLHRMMGIEYFIASIISGGVVLINLLFVAHYAGLLRLNTVANRIVFERKMNYYRFLESFTLAADKITDIAELSSYVLESLMNAVGAESAAIYLFDEDTNDFGLVARRGLDKKTAEKIKRISPEDPFIKFLQEGNIYVAKESKDFANEYDLKKIKDAFEQIHVELAIPLYYSLPLYHKRDMIGFLSLGNKKDDSPYNREDIDILNAFGRQLSICVDNAKLYSRAIIDDLTKLYRINYLNKRIQEEIERADRYLRHFSLLFIDIDDFKRINDTYGHQAGDEVLRKIGQLIKANIRKVDMAARYGGEEFSILMPEAARQGAVIAAERIRKAISAGLEKESPRLRVTVSIGVADYRPGMKKYQLMKEADDALYKAKREGKNRVCSGP